MTDIMVSRQAPVAKTVGEALDIEMRRAEAIAEAGQMLPAQYRGKPGACLLISAWAKRRGLDTWEAMQHVSFVNGHAVVSAQLMRQLAKTTGYKVVIKPGTDEASATVWEGDEELGTATFTMAEAEQAQLLKKDNWKNYAQDMLVARCSARAIRWFAPDATGGAYLEEEVQADGSLVEDPIDVLKAQPKSKPEDDIEDAVVVDDEPEIAEPAPATSKTEPWDKDPLQQTLAAEMTAEDIEASLADKNLTKNKALVQGRRIDSSIESFDDLVAKPDVLAQVLS